MNCSDKDINVGTMSVEKEVIKTGQVQVKLAHITFFLN